MSTTLTQRLRDEPPGLVSIGGREAYWTGRVAIGLRAGQPLRVETPRRVSGALTPEPISADAEALQTALLERRAPVHPVDRLLTRWGPPAIVLVLVLVATGLI